MRHHFFADVILSGAGGIEITEAMPLFYGRSIQAKAAGGEEREKGEGRRGAMGLRQDVVSGLIRDERQRYPGRQPVRARRDRRGGTALRHRLPWARGRYDCRTIEANVNAAGIVGGDSVLRLRRTLSPASGDRVIRWTALEERREEVRRAA